MCKSFSNFRAGKIVLSFGLILFLGLGISPMSFGEPKKQVAVLQIVEHPALDAARLGIQDELKENLYIEGKNLNWEYQSAQGNPALASQIAEKFIGSNPDVVIGIGTTATQALMSANRVSAIPVVFSSVTDPVGSKIVTDLKNPEGVTGVSNFIDTRIQFELFKKILPNLSKLGIIYNPGESNSVSLVKKMKVAAKNFKIELVMTTANSSVEVPSSAQQLIGKVDAIFINNDNTALSAFQSIVKIGNKHSVPVFVSDTDMVQQGALAAIGPNQYQVGRLTGKIVLKILQGESTRNIPVLFPEQTELFLNGRAAKILNIKLDDSLKNEAQGFID